MSFQWTTTFLHAEHDVDHDQFEPGIPDDGQARRHVLDFLLMDWNVSALYGFHRRFGVELSVPIRINVARAAFEDAGGTELPGFRSIHHREETLFGIGDVSAGVRVGVVRPTGPRGWYLDLRAGVSFPTGGTEHNPFELGRQGKDHQHIFFGTGTFVPVLGFETSYAFQRFQLIGWGTAQLSLYSNSRDYRASTRINAGVGAQSGFGLKTWRFLLQPEVFHETPAKWGNEDARNSGRTDLIITGGAFFRPTPSWQLFAMVKVPVYRHTVGGQLNLPVVGLLGFNFVVDVLGHGH
ncbi:MAG: hypothetical protein KC503_44930 [Myxococcales bacterium]|nr:hypothetical protein [Myxococcales bacterium]